MNSSYGKSNNKMGSIDAFDFDLGLGSGSARSMKDQKTHTTSYSLPYTNSSSQQKPNTTSSRAYQPNKPAWTPQPATSVESGRAGSLSGPTSMVGDIFGKSWNSSVPPSAKGPSIGIVNNKNPNLFGELLSSATGRNTSGNNAPLKNAAPAASKNAFSVGNMNDSLPKSNSAGNLNFGGSYNKSSSLGGANPNLGGNNNRNPNLGGIGSNKDPFGSLLDFGSKSAGGMNSSSKPSDKKSGFQNTIPKTHTSSPFSSHSFPTSNNAPLGDFGFPNSQPDNQSQPSSKQSSGANDFDALFGGGTNGASQQFSEGGDDWGMNSEFEGGNDNGGTIELEELPPPPAGVSAPAAKNKGMNNYKQGQFADAIKWLSWAVILFEKGGDDDGAMEVLTCRASCYKEVGEYKKAVADCTKVLENDGKNVSALVQRALLYESMEKYKLGAEDLRTVMNIDPGNRVARSTIHRLTNMAG